MVGEPVLLQDRPGPARGLTLNLLPGRAGGLTGGGTGITHPKVRVIGLAGHHIREDGVGRKLQRLAPGWGLQGSCVTHPAGGPAPPWPRQEPVGERKPRCSPHPHLQQVSWCLPDVGITGGSESGQGCCGSHPTGRRHRTPSRGHQQLPPHVGGVTVQSTPKGVVEDEICQNMSRYAPPTSNASSGAGAKVSHFLYLCSFHKEKYSFRLKKKKTLFDPKTPRLLCPESTAAHTWSPSVHDGGGPAKLRLSPTLGTNERAMPQHTQAFPSHGCFWMENH